eukprot:jgi/Ulvmu1/11397/UM075_0059.1
MWSVQRGAAFAAVLRTEARVCSSQDIPLLDFRTALAHVLSCESRTAQARGTTSEHQNDSLKRHDYASARRVLDVCSSLSLDAFPLCVARRSFATGAVLQHSSTDPREDPAVDPEPKRSAVDIANVLASGASLSAGGEPRQHGRPQASVSQAAPAAVTELEQTVSDPGAQLEHDVWEDFVTLVEQRKRPTPPGTEAEPSSERPTDDWNLRALNEGMETGERGAGTLRGNDAVRQMASWKEMAQWLLEYDNYDYLKPTEISRMWTQIVQLHMGSGKRGRYDERVLIYPDAPIFSSGGRAFLRALTRATRRRLQFTLRMRDGDEGYVEAMRFRAPDAGRMLWAMGKLRWHSTSLLRLLEAAAVQDVACAWNRPRYMTTALWGAAWSAPGVPLLNLCDALQRQPQEFWTDTTAQNACNAVWAMSMMRFRPSTQLSDFMQGVLLATLEGDPAAVHPQNIGDMVQALAVLRLEPREGLLEACEAWMRAHIALVLPNHIVAYLNGLGLMGRLSHAQYERFGSALRAGLDTASDAEQQVFAQRLYVLRHLAHDTGAGGSPPPGELPSEGGASEDPAPSASEVDEEFLEEMQATGRDVVLRMLADTGAAVTQDPDAALLVDLLASCGYAATAAPLEELLAATGGAAASDGDSEGGADGDAAAVDAPVGAAVTPLLPELYVRTRQVGAAGEVMEALDAPRVAVQIIRAEDCMCNAETAGPDAVLGEAALVHSTLSASGQTVVQVFPAALAALPDVAAMQAALEDLLGSVLPAGERAAAPILEEEPEEEQEAQQEAAEGGEAVAEGAGVEAEVEYSARWESAEAAAAGADAGPGATQGDAGVGSAAVVAAG